jgi:hypothetical protein
MPNLKGRRDTVSGPRLVGSQAATVPPMPRHWIWMQVVILVFVLAGMVIAIVRLA